MKFLKKMKWVFEIIFWVMVIAITAYGLFTENVFHLLAGTLGIVVGLLSRMEDSIDKILFMVNYDYNMKKIQTATNLLKVANEVMEELNKAENNKKCKCQNKTKTTKARKTKKAKEEKEAEATE